MNEASSGGFNTEKQRAIERMKEMNARARYKQNARTDLNLQKGERKEQNAATGSPFPPRFNIPFLKGLDSDPDISLILGLALILISERSDKLLLMALLYILL
ncbi:MAG: hypothetical protein J5659_00500 [Clostridia bacterium]|nr:hypothetical protein [Clostridia bacterium]